MLGYAIQDEYLARAEYYMIMDKFGKIKPFSNIVEAGEYHIKLLSVRLRIFDGVVDQVVSYPVNRSRIDP